MDDENKRLIEAVKHYQQNIEKYSGTGNSVKLLHAIERLKRLPVKVSHLQETGVGITVNALRKLGGDVGDSSKALVAKWKEMVLEEEVERREKEERERNDESDDSADDSIEDKENSSENGDSKDNRHKNSNSRDYKTGNKRKERSSSESSGNDTNSDKDNDESNSSKNSNEKQKENNQSSDEETYRKDKKKQEHKSKKTDEYRHKNLERRKEETRRRDEHKSKKRCKESSDEENNKKDKKTHEHSSKKHQTHSDEERDVKIKENGSKRQHESEATSRNHKKSKHSRDHSEERRKSKNSKHKEEHKDSREHSSSRSKKEERKPSEKEKTSSRSKPSKEKENRSHSSESSEHKDKKEKHKKEETKSKKSEDINKSDEKHKKHSDTSKHKSSSAEKSDRNKKEQSKSKKPASTEKIVNEIDSESGASFAEALGMLEAPVVISRSKKKFNSESDKPKSRPSTSTSSSSSKKSVSVSNREENVEEYVPPLLKDKQLEPLDINISSLLPSITPNYRPLSFPLDNQNRRVLTDDEALSRVMSNKNQRTKVYSGNKTLWNTVPSLFELCTRILQDNIDALEYTGGVPYTILKPILEKANPDQLYMLEHHNPYIIEDSDELWQLHCQKEFRNKRREELESWRDMYMRCLDEREAKLKALTANIKQAQDKSLPVRTTKMAFVDDVVKPPRSVARKQVKNGSAMAMKKPTQTPQQRLTQLATAGEAGKVTVPNPGSRAAERSGNSTSSIKPKKAPLMAKTLSLFKNRFGRR